MTFNACLWAVPNTLGWWFWAPFLLYGVYGLNKIYRLAPAETALGRWCRVLLTMGFTCLIFIPFFNGLGPYAFHLLTIGVCLVLKQAYAACVMSGKIRPATAPTFVERTVERMIAR